MLYGIVITYITDIALTEHEETPRLASPTVPTLQEEVPPSQQLPTSPQPSTSLVLPEAVPPTQADQGGPSTQDEEVSQNVSGLSADIINILGIDPTAIVEYGPAISTDLANRLQHIVTCGLKKEERKEFEKRYLIPENCQLIAAPIMNAEVKATLSEINLKRDKAIESRQKSVAIVISCLSKAITTQICSTEPDHELLQQLVDATRLLCDIQYINSSARKTLALSYVKKELKEQLSNTKIGKHLFGDNFGETIKNVKAVSKSSAELKIQSKKPESSSKHLNWKSTSGTRRLAPAQSAPRRQPPPPPPPPASSSFQHRQHLPPPPARPPRNYSSGSSHRPRQTRGR